MSSRMHTMYSVMLALVVVTGVTSFTLKYDREDVVVDEEVSCPPRAVPRTIPGKTLVMSPRGGVNLSLSLSQGPVGA